MNPSIKDLSLTHEPYEVIHQAFSRYLQARGYSLGSQRMLPTCIREFLFQNEQKCKWDLNEITPEDVQTHYQFLTFRPNFRKRGSGLSPSMLNHHVFALRTFFAWLEQIGGIKGSPMAGLDFPRPFTPARKPLSLNNIKLLYNACECARDKALLGVYYACGLRRSEGEDLNTDDINYAEAKLIIRHGKFKKRREVPLHAKVMQHFQTYFSGERKRAIEEHESLDRIAFLVNNHGRRISGSIANCRVQFLARKAQIPETLSLHNLRHSIATHLKDNGMPLEQIMEYLGHGSMDVTQNYLKGYRTNWNWQIRHAEKMRYKDEEACKTPDYDRPFYIP